MWYHTDINDRILECCGELEPARLTTPPSLQKLAATSAIRARVNFYQSAIPSRIKDYLSFLCEGIEVSQVGAWEYFSHRLFICSSAPTVLSPATRRAPVSKCSHSRILTSATPASPSSTGRAAWSAPGRSRSPPGGSSCARPSSRTESTSGTCGRV